MTNHYVNNEQFLKEVIFHNKKCKLAKKEQSQKPIAPNYIGECLLKIANNLSSKGNFRDYPFREEMVLDGVENCLTYMHNFDPKKSKNPFAYFTQIIYYAFLRRIQKEKLQLYTKGKISDMYIATDAGYADISGRQSNAYGHISVMEESGETYMGSLISSIEHNDKVKKQKAKDKKDKKDKLKKPLTKKKK